MAESHDVIFMLSLILFLSFFVSKKFCTNFGSFFNIILQGVAKFPPVSLKKTVTAGKGTALDSFFFRVSILDQMKDRRDLFKH